MAYITAADIKAYLPQSAALDTGLLTTIADRATAIVDTALGFRYGTAAASARTVYGTGTPYLLLPTDTVFGSVTSVSGPAGLTVPSYTVDGRTLIALDSLGNQVSVYPAPFYSDPDYGRPHWARGVPYVVNATFGAGAVPADIVQVTLEVAINIWRSKDKGSFTDVIGPDGVAGTRFVGGLTNQQRAIVSAHAATFGRAGVW